MVLNRPVLRLYKEGSWRSLLALLVQVLSSPQVLGGFLGGMRVMGFKD